jgi:hypothetical protein
MSPHQVVGLAVRLFAIWLALQGVPYLIEASNMPLEGGPAVSYVLGATFIVVALALWLFPMTIAHQLLARVPPDDPLSANSRELVHLAVVVTGMLLLALKVPALLWYFARWFLIQVSDKYDTETPLAVNAQVLVTTVQVAVGIAFVAKPSQIARWIVPRLRG